jgi:hypothetical protein
VRDSDDGAEIPEVGAAVPFPQKVKVAGLIWLTVGGLILVGAVVSSVLILGGSGDHPGKAPGAGCVGVLQLLVGLVFLHVGNQTVRGTARDTLGNGIGSLIFGLISLVYGGFMIVAVVVTLAGRVKEDAVPVMVAFGIVAVLGIVAGLGLLLAGILALVGRDDYQAWRREHAPRPKRRRD